MPERTGSAIVIRKSSFGLFVTYLVGGLAVAGLLVAFAASVGGHGLTLRDTQPKLLLLGVLVVVLGTFVQAYVHMLSKVILDTHELRFVTWLSVFSTDAAVCEWRQVRAVDAKRSGVFSQAFDYGTLLVQTGSTERDLRIPMIPNVEHWRDVIATRANQAAMPMSEQA
jgi:hypothetical protein